MSRKGLRVRWTFAAVLIAIGLATVARIVFVVRGFQIATKGQPAIAYAPNHALATVTGIVALLALLALPIGIVVAIVTAVQASASRKKTRR